VIIHRRDRRNVLRLFNEHDTLIKVVPRTSSEEVTRYKAYAHQHRTNG